MSSTAILIVDDEQQMAKFVASVVAMEGLEPVIATSAKECLEKLNEVAPIGIFMDIFMPDMDGIELIQEVSRSNNPAPVVVMSGYNPQFMGAAKEIGNANGAPVIGMLAKPFSIDEVLAYVRTIQATIN